MYVKKPKIKYHVSFDTKKQQLQNMILQTLNKIKLMEDENPTKNVPNKKNYRTDLPVG